MSNSHSHKRLISKSLLSLTVAAAVPAMAQSNTAALEEIVVTAERRTATLQETDISMMAFSSDALEEIGFSDYRDISIHVPNVMVAEMPGRGGYSVNIRGFKNGETVPTFEPKVAIYLDGVLLSKSAGSAFDIIDMERVEVLRGPQGTLYGRNTAGGAINLITKKPYDELGGSVSVSLGDYNQRDVKGTLNLPLVGPNGILSNDSEARLAMKINLASLQREGYWNNDYTGAPRNLQGGIDAGGAAPDELGDKDRQVAHVQLQYQPNDDVTVLYSYDKSEIDESPWPYVMTAENPAFPPDLTPFVESSSNPSSVMQDADSFLISDAEGHSLTVDWSLSDTATLTSITAYRESILDSFQDADASPEFILHNIASHDYDVFSQELRLAGAAMDERLDYVVGAYYMDEQINDFFFDSQLGLFGIISASGGSAENEVWAVFGEGTYALTDKLDLTAGLRYTEEDRSMSKTDSLTILALGATIPTPFPDASDTWDDVSGTLSLSYDWTDDVMTYLKFSKGYVSGGYNARAPGIEAFEAGYDEETVFTYELGWKTTLLDRRLRLNGAIFYNDYKDLQVNRFDPETTRNNIANAGDATIQGLEIEFVARVTNNFELGGGYGYLDPEYQSFIDPFTGVDLADTFQWPHTPEHSFNAYGRYEVALPMGDLSFRIDYVNVDEHPMLPAIGTGLNDEDGYELVNGRIALAMPGPGESDFTVAFWGKNMTDEVYRSSGVDIYTNAGLGYTINTLGAPRTYGVDLKLSF